jgi:hypothetical protein
MSKSEQIAMKQNGGYKAKLEKWQRDSERFRKEKLTEGHENKWRQQEDRRSRM